MKRAALTLLACTLTAGCGGLLRSSAPRPLIYTPSVPAQTPLVPQLSSVLVIARPESGPGLDTNAISVALPDHRLDVLAGARWSAPVPELVKAYLVESAGDSGGWRTVVTDGSVFGADFLLQTEIRRFTAVYADAASPPLVQVWLHGELGRLHGHQLIASIDALGEARATANRQSAVVAAFQAALAQASAKLINDAHEASAAAPPATP